MLVMTTIFTNLMDKLPPTAYVKMIDIWLIGGQLIPFIEVVFLTIIEMLIPFIEMLIPFIEMLIPFIEMLTPFIEMLIPFIEVVLLTIIEMLTPFIEMLILFIEVVLLTIIEMLRDGDGSGTQTINHHGQPRVLKVHTERFRKEKERGTSAKLKSETVAMS